VIVLQLVASLRIFDQYYLMAGGGSNLSPENVAIQYIYNSGFVGFRIGYASALSYILFFFILIVALELALIGALQVVQERVEIPGDRGLVPLVGVGDLDEGSAHGRERVRDRLRDGDEPAPEGRELARRGVRDEGFIAEGALDGRLRGGHQGFEFVVACGHGGDGRVADPANLLGGVLA
jgi:hypothetical protein